MKTVVCSVCGKAFQTVGRYARFCPECRVERDRELEREKRKKRKTERPLTSLSMDMISLTLNDPEVMGKDTFGYDRLLKVLHGVEKNFDRYADALTKKANADYCREKLGENLARICGDKLIPFEKRYDWVAKISYGK